MKQIFYYQYFLLNTLCLLGQSNFCNSVDLYAYQSISIGQVGGGGYYLNKINIDNSFHIVQNENELREAIDNSSIEKIFISGYSCIEIYEPIIISRDNLLICSDRGQFDSYGRLKKGAEIKLKHSTEVKHSIFEVYGNNIRLSGIRFTSENINDNYSGVNLNGKITQLNLEITIDNCEFYNFGYAGIQVDGTIEPNSNTIKSIISHNHIHSNNKSGLGYGIVINYHNSEAEIYYNYFDNNRHSVAGNGRAGEKYFAAYNLTLSNKMNASEYDMHGFSDYNKNNCHELQNCDYNASCNNAGESIVLLNNAVINSKYFLGLRGIPEDKAISINNLTSSPSLFKIWRTWSNNESCQLAPPHDENITLSQNDWDEFNFFECQNFTEELKRSAYYVSWSGINKWSPLFFNTFNHKNIHISDFNGDNIDDLFYTNESNWHLSNSAIHPLEYLNASSYPIASLMFGNFNNDANTDVLLADGNNWKVSWSGTSSWETINTSSYKNESLMLGDFNGDGVTDIFRADGNNWKVSWSGTSSWEIINTSSYTNESLMLGDFNGDGVIDIFRADGVKWNVSWSGISRWETINYSSYLNSSLKFGDFNGDDKTDIIRILVNN